MTPVERGSQCTSPLHLHLLVLTGTSADGDPRQLRTVVILRCQALHTVVFLALLEVWCGYLGTSPPATSSRPCASGPTCYDGAQMF